MAIQNPVLWQSVEGYVYKKEGSKTPFNKKDLKSYKSLCSLYKRYVQAEQVPEQWTLDDENCPIYSSIFTVSEEVLDSCGQYIPGLKTQILSMVVDINGLLRARGSTRKFRPDGFESMFLNE